MNDTVAQQTFTGEDFSKAAMSKREYEECRFVNCNFAGSTLSKARFIDCEFTGCDLSLANVSETCFNEVTFANCKMLGIRLDTISQFIISFSFDSCLLDDTSFYKLKIPSVVFKHCRMHRVDLTEADLTAASFAECDLTDATFDGTIVEKADFITAYNYIINPAVNRIRKAKFSVAGLPGLLQQYDIKISP